MRESGREREREKGGRGKRFQAHRFLPSQWCAACNIISCACQATICYSLSLLRTSSSSQPPSPSNLVCTSFAELLLSSQTVSLSSTGFIPPPHPHTPPPSPPLPSPTPYTPLSPPPTNKGQRITPQSNKSPPSLPPSILHPLKLSKHSRPPRTDRPSPPRPPLTSQPAVSLLQLLWALQRTLHLPLSITYLYNPYFPKYLRILIYIPSASSPVSSISTFHSSSVLYTPPRQ